MNGKRAVDEEWVFVAVEAALRAGEAILGVYGQDFEVAFKEDQSPLTEADRAAHELIAGLLKRTGLPVLSEESKAVPYEERRKWTRYWLVDPLDGTKEFIKKNGEFTVNIALIEGGRPVLGVVYAPVLKTLYFGIVQGAEGMGPGAWRATECADQSADEIFPSAVSLPITNNESPITGEAAPLRVVASRSHCNDETRAFIADLEASCGSVERVSSGSSLKLCLVAEGRADVYPRIAPTMEWDTAAAQAVVEAAGGRVVKYDPTVPPSAYLQGAAHDLRSEKEASSAMPQILCPLSYNKPDLLNPFFVVIGGGGK